MFNYKIPRNGLRHKWKFGMLLSMSYKFEGEYGLYVKSHWENDLTGGTVEYYCPTVIHLTFIIII